MKLSLSPSSFLSVVTILAISTTAGISVYNPATDTTEDANSATGLEIPPTSTKPQPAVRYEPQELTPPPKTHTKTYVPKKTKIPPKPAKSLYLGEVVIFTSIEGYTPLIAENIQKIQAIKNIDVTLYMEAKNPKQYFTMLPKFMKADKTLTYPSFKVDTGNRAYNRYNPGRYERIVYTDPTGAIRRYDLKTGVFKLFRHIKRIKEAQQAP